MICYSVTNFFRDPQSFDSYVKRSSRPFLSKKPGKIPSGLGSGLRQRGGGLLHGDMPPGTSGGKASGMKIQIFATDIFRIAIARARTVFINQLNWRACPPRGSEQFFTN